MLLSIAVGSKIGVHDSVRNGSGSDRSGDGCGVIHSKSVICGSVHV